MAKGGPTVLWSKLEQSILDMCIKYSMQKTGYRSQDNLEETSGQSWNHSPMAVFIRYFGLVYTYILSLWLQTPHSYKEKSNLHDDSDLAKADCPMAAASNLGQSEKAPYFSVAESPHVIK